MKKTKFIINIYLLISCYFLLNTNCDDGTSSEPCSGCVSDGLTCNIDEDDPSKICGSNCKPRYGSTNCYNCNIGNQFYFINEDNSCNINCNQEFIIYESNECVGSCDNSLYKIGNFCYKNCPSNSESVLFSKECKCKFKYYIEKIGEKDLYHCLSNEENCPSNYKFYNFETGECSINDNCPSELKLRKFETNSNGEIQRCSRSCLNEEYYQKIDNNEYCVDICNNIIYIEPGTNKRMCLNDCSEVNLYKKNDKCVNQDECNFYIPNKCLDSCEEDGTNRFHNFDSKECISGCTDEYKYLGENNICYKLDNCNFVNEGGNKCLLSCNIGEGFYIMGDPEKKCYISCGNSVKKYHNYDSNICIENCSSNSNEKKYQKEHDFICYSSCKDIEDGTYIYETNGVCSQTPCELYHINNNGVKSCISSESDCVNKGFIYLKENECVDECNDYKIYHTEGSTSLIECLNSIDECANKGYYFYNNNLKQCWSDLPDNSYINSNRDGKYEVVFLCEKFVYENEYGQKTCINNCKDIGYYFFSDKNECIEECKITTNSGDKFYYYDPTNNECLKTCKDRNNLKFAYKNENRAQECLSYCPTQKYVREIVDGIEIYKCVDHCEGGKAFFDVKNKECISETECSADKYYKVNNLCYPICSENNYYIDTSTYNCLATCPSGMTKLEKLSNDYPFIFLCKRNCLNNEYILDDKCLSKCPDKYYIGNNNICRQTCTSDLNGEYYYIFEEDSSSFIIYKCVDSCINDYGNFYYISSNPKKCLNNCPDLFNYVLENNNECLEKCPDDNPFYDKNHTPHYICKSNSICQDYEFFLDGECVNKETCINNQKIYINSKNICLEGCNKMEYKQKNYIDSTFDNTYSCKRKCDYYILGDNEDDLECVLKCPKNYNYIGKNEKCKQKCEEEDGIYYYKIENGIENEIEYEIYKCIDSCTTSFNLKINGSLQCFDSCPENYKYKSEDENRCYDNCLSSKTHPFTLPGPEKKCSDKCNDDYPNYGENKICQIGCDSLVTNIKDHDGKCVSQCNYTSIYKFKDGNECKDKCTGANGLRYSTNNYECKLKCIEPENIVDENKCKSTCEDGQFYQKVTQEVDGELQETGEYKCVPICNPNEYYYEKENICLPSCRDGDKAVEGINKCVRDCNSIKESNYYLYQEEHSNMCVKKCPETKLFADGYICVNICPGERKYYIKTFEHENEESNDQKKCLTDCPKDYPYYTIRIDEHDSSKKYYECQGKCEGYYIENLDLKINSKLCLNSCPDSSNPDYKYKIIDGTNKKCYKDCPSNKPYHKIEDGSDCLIGCPDDAPFHEENSYICIPMADCSTEYINYDSKICTSSCPSTKLRTNYRSKIICSEECISDYGEYLTPDNKCVVDCTSETGKNLINDLNNKKCICKNLFYINEMTFQMECFDDAILNCKDTDFKIKIYETKECIKICNNNRILSPSEDICYEKNYNCPLNSHLIIKNNQRKCECSYKFYIDTENKKICLDENSVCPSNYGKYIPETMQCIKTSETCPSDYPYLFENFCLHECPKGSEQSGYNCNRNNKYWYEASKGNYECLDGFCLDSYPVYAPSTKQCLKKCKGSYYPYLYDNKCYNDCNSIENTIAINAVGVITSSDLALYSCECIDPWYFDENKKMICPERPNSILDCSSYSSPFFKFMIKKTKQCVNECPINYPYFFNQECFSSCENEAKSVYLYKVKTVKSSYECECENLWYYIDVEKTKKECISEEECFLFDENMKYKIYKTNECVEDCPPNLYKFNFTCYDKCPENTIDKIDDVNGNYCICNNNYKYWYDYQKYGKTYYICGLSECPINNNDNFIRSNLLEKQKKCVKSCTNDGGEDNEYKYAFRNICIKKCPYLTKTVYDECKFYDLDDEDNINTLEKLKNAANIQAKELYEKNSQIGGYLLNKFDASLQIYSIDKYNSLKQLSIKSNLTYIDLDTCIDKIFTNNNFTDNDKILVTKYDLLPNSNFGGDDTLVDNDNSNQNTGNENKKDNKYLINQVEYEFYSSKTMEKIDASICDPYELIISYPIFFNKNNFNNYKEGVNQNNYKEKFDIGKDLYNKNNKIDTFNYNNTIYKDMCIGVEINGKDLILEDRYKYLYPNNVSLCESNCTINNTDFDLERIVCLCSYKEIFDFNRKEEDRNDLLNDPNFHTPTQSSANMEIIKCLSKLSVKDAIVNNEAFYFCTVIFAIKISMVFVSVFYGYQSAFSNIITLFNKTSTNINNGINTDYKADKNKGNKLNNDNIVTTSHRILNNPPRKNNDNDNDSDSNDNNNNNNNIINNKNIEINYDNTAFEPENNNNSQADNDDGDLNFGIKKKTDLISQNNNNNYNNMNKNVNYNNNNIKAEYIPPEYNFKYFKLNDQGVKKKIERNKIPFEINPDTKYLIERRQGIEYDDNYLNGPYLPTQNILEIIDVNNNDNKVIKYGRNEILNKLSLNNTSNNNIISNDNNIKQNIQIEHKKPREKIIEYNNLISNNNNNNKEEKNFITIKKIVPSHKPKSENKIIVEDYNNNNENKNRTDDNIGLFTLIKREQTYLRLNYNKYTEKSHPNILSIFLAEILDKIYLIKIFLFLKKFEILSVHLSLYCICHMLLLTLLCTFFTIKVIRKIWEESNFPDINFYLLYGLISNIIIWVIYKIFLCLLDNQDKVKELVIAKNKMNIEHNNNNEEENNNALNDDFANKFNDLKKDIKIKMIIFYVITFILGIFCFIYLVSFFGIYTGTKSKIFTAYFISLIEIVLIKLVYGICLASLRIAGEGNELKILYKIVYIFDKYIS